MLRLENLFVIHAGKKVIALIEFADMVEAEPAIFAGAVMAAAAAIEGRRAKFAAFFTPFNRAAAAVGFDATVKAVGFSFRRSFGQNPT